jgi:ABC-type transport system involved in multi-copper enzyme maturation permease subunit
MMNPSARAGRIRVAAILVGKIIVWQTVVHRQNRPGQVVSLNALATYGQSLFITIVSIEPTLVRLAAPAATAGAVCLEKARRTLDHMLATDLSNAEIIFGKLGILFAAVAATFDRCLGRMPETGECRAPDFRNAHTTRL